MKRLLLILVAAIVACLGFAAPSASAGEVPISTVHTYGYDSHAQPATLTLTTTERGPPACDHPATTDNAVAFWSEGALACPGNAAAGVIYAYDAPVIHGQVGSAAGTTNGPARPNIGDLSPLQPRHVAANAGSSLAGKSYGLGTVVENPGLAIQGFRGSKTPGHTINRIINRGVSPSMLRDTVANPKVVLRQGSGNYYHLSDEAAVVLRPDGQVVTAYGRADFKQHVLDILADVG